MVSTNERDGMANDANGGEESNASDDIEFGTGTRVRVHGVEPGSFW